jgi:Glycosyl transferase family 2
MPASSAPLVSVVIATYNRPAYLRNAIASVINGEYRNVEIVVADGDLVSGEFIAILSIPVAQASVIRRAAIDWRDFPVEVDAAWDLWLGYLACRTGKGCYYHPERLTRYRVHGGSVTATGSNDGGLGMILIYARLMARPELAGLRREIRNAMRRGASFVRPAPAASGTRARSPKASPRRRSPAGMDAEARDGVRAGEHAGRPWRPHAAGAAPRAPMVTTLMRRAERQ